MLNLDLTRLAEAQRWPQLQQLADAVQQNAPLPLQQQVVDGIENLHANINTPGAFCKWVDLPLAQDMVEQVSAYAQSVKGQFESVVHIGIGGSCLGPAALLEALIPSYWNELSSQERNGNPKFYFIDNVDGDKLQSVLKLIDPKTTLISIVTKSGNTTETLSAFLVFYNLLVQTVGEDQANKQVVCVTDPEKGLLKQLATQHNWPTFDVAPDVGGRFSVFSPVGLIPAALAGINIAELFEGLQTAYNNCKETNLKNNPAALAALANFLAWQQGTHQTVMMPYNAKLSLTSDWFVQLWAESLGKQHDKDGKEVFVGSTPIKAVGVTDQHSQLQLFNDGPFDKLISLIFVDSPKQQLPIPTVFNGQAILDNFQGLPMHRILEAEAKATRDSLVQSGRPVITYSMPQLDANHYAQLLYVLQVQTALMGWLMNINPFDQPGVELSKKITARYLNELRVPS